MLIKKALNRYLGKDYPKEESMARMTETFAPPSSFNSAEDLVQPTMGGVLKSP